MNTSSTIFVIVCLIFFISSFRILCILPFTLSILLFRLIIYCVNRNERWLRHLEDYSRIEEKDWGFFYMGFYMVEGVNARKRLFVGLEGDFCEVFVKFMFDD